MKNEKQKWFRIRYINGDVKSVVIPAHNLKHAKNLAEVDRIRRGKNCRVETIIEL